MYTCVDSVSRVSVSSVSLNGGSREAKGQKGTGMDGGEGGCVYVLSFVLFSFVILF